LVLGLGVRVRVDLDAEMCSGSEVGSYLRLIDFVNHSTQGLRVIKKKESVQNLQHRVVQTFES